MKFYSRLGIYKASNVVFDAKSLDSYSYSWWKITRKIGPYIVFNDYNYSKSTRRHQSKIRSLMCKLGIEVSADVQAPQGLQNLDAARQYYIIEISNIEAEIAKPRSQKLKNEWRRSMITQRKLELAFVTKLMTIEAREFKKSMQGVSDDPAE